MDGRVASPKIDELLGLRPPLTAGELEVAHCFDQILPTGWEIYAQPHLNGLKPDFVLLNPNVGIAVFEIKDWNLTAMDRRWKRGARGGWHLYRTNSRGVEFRSANPLAKILYYKQALAELYVPSLSANSVGTPALAAITAGLIFPNATQQEINQFFGPALDGSEQRAQPCYNPLVSREDLESRELMRIFPEARRARSHVMNERCAHELRAWLVEPEYIKDQRAAIVLDERQTAIVERRTKTGYQRVRGPAGSGKTVVLASKAARLEEQGKRCLILVFNLTLVNYIRDMISRARFLSKTTQRSVEIHSFHSWCKQQCHQYGFDSEYKDLWRSIGLDSEPAEIDSSRQAVLDEGLAALAKRVLTEAQKTFGDEVSGYDAILVDEGQDFRPSWWAAARNAARQDSELILFADMTQDLYETASYWTDQVMAGAGFRGPWAELKTAYRIPPEFIGHIRDFGEKFLSGYEMNLPEMTQLGLGRGLKIRWLQVSRDEVLSVAADAVLAMPAFTEAEDVAFSDVVLLSDDKRVGHEIVSWVSSKGVSVSHTYQTATRDQRVAKVRFYLGREKVKATTIHSFKGLEARYLVICVTRPSTLGSLAALYVALTRLKAVDFGSSFITVVCTVPALADYGASWR